LQPIYAADHDISTVETYRRNFGNHVEKVEINLETRLPEASVIVGGPPCQGFSSAGKRQNGDHRNTLVAVFAALVAAHRPSAFVFENVEGFLTAEEGGRVLDLLTPLVEAGYRIHVRKINAANYGVPQLRKRVLVLGALGWDPALPDPTHAAFGAPGAHLAARTLPGTPTLREAIAGLEAPADEPPGDPHGHFAGALSEEDSTRVALLRQGQTMRDLPEDLWHSSYQRRAFRRVMDGTPSERRGGAPAGLRRLVFDEPSKAITSAARAEFVHPVENRFLTLRECARLQTFPDEFVFCGSWADQAVQIGNAVPPLLGEVLGRSLVRQLASARPARVAGKLLSFVPTLSNGMSPALEHTVRVVCESFGLWQRPSHVQQELQWS
jgi:DNA (cytosine-5)-methyltransferase 1